MAIPHKIQQDYKFPEPLESWKNHALALWNTADPQSKCRIPPDILWEKILIWEHIRNWRCLHVLAKVCKRWHHHVFGVILARQYTKLLLANENQLSKNLYLRTTNGVYVTESTCKNAITAPTLFLFQFIAAVEEGSF